MPGDQTNSRRADPALLVSLALFVVTVALYWPATGYGFVNFDDTRYVTDNAHLRAGLSLVGWRWAFTTLDAEFWHPVTWLSYLADYSLHGLFAGGYHLTNLLLHAANTVLVFQWLRRATRTLWPGALVAALFGWHPLHVESVAWIAERKDLTSTFFMLLTLLAYSRYANESKVPSLKSRLFYVLTLVCYVLGLMSKPMLVTLPCLLLLLDWWPLNRLPVRNGTGEAARWRGAALKLVAEKIPFFFLAFVVGVATVVAQRSGGSLKSFDEVPLSLRLMNALVALARYLWNTVWPARLGVYYPLPSAISPLAAAGAAALLAGICWVVFRRRGRQPWLLVGWVWFLITIAPVIGIIQVGRHAMADRYTYIPAIGLFMMASWSVNEALARRPSARRVGFAVVGGILLLCLVAARAQLACWRDSISLFSQALAVTRENAFAENSLAAALANTGRSREAIEHYTAAVRIKPDYVLAHYNLGIELAANGQPAGAEIHFLEALRYGSKSETLRNNLGVVLAQQNKLDSAADHFSQAIRLNPDYPKPYVNLAMIQEKQGMIGEAITNYSKALALEPNAPEAADRLALLFATRPEPEWRRPAEAVRLAELANELTFHRDAACLQVLARAYAAAGRFPDAVEAIGQAREIAVANGSVRLMSQLDKELESCKANRIPETFRESVPVFGVER